MSISDVLIFSKQIDITRADPGFLNGGVNFCNTVREIKYYFNI